MPNPEDQRVIFLHIPKTAGMSFRGLLAKNYRGRAHFNTDAKEALHGDWEAYQDRIRSLPLDEVSRYRVFKGHMQFGLHKALPFPTRYITFLREPVKRFVSHFHMVCRLNTLSENHVIDPARPDWNLREWPTANLYLDNCQTRILAGASVDLPLGECTEKHLQQAKTNLDRHIPFVGLTEQFNLSLLLLGRTCGWKWHFYIPDNIAPSIHEPVPSETLQAIRDLNRFDLELYDYARQRFEQQVKECGFSLQAEYQLFTFGNVLHKKLHVVRHRLKHRLGIEKRASQFLAARSVA